MSGWHEDNFLEKLMPTLRRKLAAERGPCPDAETLSAVAEGVAAPALTEVVAGHLKQCPACTGLYSRLLNFEKGGVPARRGEWEGAQKRLDNWLTGFLASEAARSRPHSHWRRWRIPWIAGLAAAALLVATLGFIRRDTKVLPPAPVEARAELPRILPATPTPIETKTVKPIKPAPKHISPLAVEDPPVAQPVEPGVVEQAASARESPPESPPQAPPPAASDGASRASRAFAHAPAMSRARLPVQAPLPPPAPAAPASLRMEAGTAVWIRLSSVRRQTDGSFTFRGTLLLPVAPANVILLDRGTQVDGSGTTVTGQTSLHIKEFVVRGVRYTLKDPGGAINAAIPGNGKTVPFDAGRVLELFLASASTYEQAPK